VAGSWQLGSGTRSGGWLLVGDGEWWNHGGGRLLPLLQEERSLLTKKRIGGSQTLEILQQETAIPSEERIGQ
jgi:hypothetical protein